ncbi:hypothetical protein V8Z74_14705 [Comamonas sp. w2-DMI]|uniref:hypothetical protein n=1 Tax=Comamonas sp. w2-DMI TaxID=3126391 RepID=UPI0032E52CE4
MPYIQACLDHIDKAALNSAQFILCVKDGKLPINSSTRGQLEGARASLIFLREGLSKLCDETHGKSRVHQIYEMAMKKHSSHFATEQVALNLLRSLYAGYV